MNQRQYTIIGTPEAALRTTKMARLSQDSYNIRRRNYQQQLINQHDDDPFLSGPWDLTCEFMFELPVGKPKRHIMYPSLVYLVRFFDELAHNVIYSDSCIIHHLTLIKSYEPCEPKSIFTFTKVK